MIVRIFFALLMLQSSLALANDGLRLDCFSDVIHVTGDLNESPKQQFSLTNSYAIIFDTDGHEVIDIEIGKLKGRPTNRTDDFAEKFPYEFHKKNIFLSLAIKSPADLTLNSRVRGNYTYKVFSRDLECFVISAP